MKEIKVDMFEVQLGAAILLQFKRTEGNWVSVLADAGIDASGYPLEHVRDKLLKSGTLQSVTSNVYRIDLMIGTHYDKDHLSGLVPIIKETKFEIGEAWLPPVANDTELHAIDDPLDEMKLLAFQFAADGGAEKLNRYLKKKKQICQEISSMLNAASIKSENIDLDFDELMIKSIEKSRIIDVDRVDEDTFDAYLKEANTIIGETTDSHVGADVESLLDSWEFQSTLDDPVQWWWYNSKSLEEKIFTFNTRWNHDKEYIKRDCLSFAYIQKSAAKDAINASSLYKVVEELQKRKIQIRCQIIDDGIPQHFNWNDLLKRFIGAKKKSDNEPVLTLLGPSQKLVKKHWHRLPLGQYTAKLAFTSIPKKSITPSNQLSYVARFDYDKQGILITGDAGFVDFSKKRGKYYPALLNELLPLHIVQIAHHGGRNAHFYHVLLKADYATQTDSSFLLLSHATNDKHRPSSEFAKFVDQLRAEGNDIRLLFTSRPKFEKVKDYDDLIYPVKPTSAEASEGDVRLHYTSQVDWKVEKHCIKVQ